MTPHSPGYPAAQTSQWQRLSAACNTPHHRHPLPGWSHAQQRRLLSGTCRPPPGDWLHCVLPGPAGRPERRSVRPCLHRCRSWRLQVRQVQVQVKICELLLLLYLVFKLSKMKAIQELSPRLLCEACER